MAVLQSCFAIFTCLVLLQLERTETTHNSLGSPPQFATQHPNVYVYETNENGNRQDLILLCCTDAPSPTVNYTWFRGNEELPGSMVNGEGSLVIPNITEGEYASREGVDYYCIASDNIGFDVAVRSRNITVYYAYFNGFERMAESGENTVEIPIPVALNSDVALECDVLDANPPPQIKWCNDQGEIQEVRDGNRIRLLDGGHYLYLRNLQATQLEQQYYCNVTNANLSLEVSAPTRYVLIDNITQGELIEYKQIGNLRAFLGNTSFEFSYVSGLFGEGTNRTINRFTVNDIEVAILGSIGNIPQRILTMPGIVHLKAAVSYSGMTEMRSGTLTIYQLPRIINTVHDERNHFVGEGSLTYSCLFEGFPLPNITFYFNGAIISSVSEVTITENTLTIPSPQVSHSGIYQWIASNEFGDDQQAWLLKIRPPVIPQVLPYNLTDLGGVSDRDLGTLIVRDGGSIVSLSFNIVADPCPNVMWTFNGIQLGPSNEIFTYNNPCISANTSSHNWTFILNVRLSAITSGNYSGSFSNIAGTTPLHRTYLTIPEPTSVIGLSLNYTCLKEGTNVSVRCNVRGFPRPRVEFQLNGITIIPGSRAFENFVQEFYDQISITNVSMNVEGLYSCSALGSSSPEVHAQFTFCSVPKIIATEATPNPQIGESFFLQCSAAGIPNPTIVWTKDGFPLNANDLPHMNRSISSIIVVSNAGAEHNGIYTCIASNNAGSVSASFLINLQENGASLSLGAAVAITAILEGLILSIVFGLLLILVHTCVNRPDHKSNERNVNQSLECSANPAYGTHGIVTEVSRNCDEVVPQYEVISDLQLSRSRQTRPADL